MRRKRTVGVCGPSISEKSAHFHGILFQHGSTCVVLPALPWLAWISWTGIFKLTAENANPAQGINCPTAPPRIGGIEENGYDVDRQLHSIRFVHLQRVAQQVPQER